MAQEPRKTRNGQRWALMKNLTVIAAVILCVVLALGTLVDKNFGMSQRAGLEVVGSLQKASTSFGNRLGQLYDDYLGFISVRAENKRLHGEVEMYLLQLAKYRAGYNEAKQLRTQLNFKKKDPRQSITAEIVGRGGVGSYQVIVVDVGRNDDVRAGMIAYAPAGVVGQVVAVSSGYAKILLANAPSSAIDAIVQKNRVRGILKGSGEAACSLEYVLKNDDVAVGDMVVTAGIGGVFPRGMPLGTISEIYKKRRGMFWQIVVTPAVDFDNLQYLFIDLTDRREIQDLLHAEKE